MKRPSRRQVVKGSIGYRKSPSKAFIERRLIWNDVSGMKDARAAMASILEQVNKNMNLLGGDITMEAINYTLQPTFDMSQIFCPIDTGALQESGYLIVENASAGPTGEIGYAAGNEPPYAIQVHERLDLHHTYPTRAKWLQAAMEQTIGNMLQRLRAFYAEAGLAT